MTAPLAATDFSEPALWAVIIGWVMSVTLHEFAHGIVGYWGGDYTVRERGGLTLNPLQYVDPVMSLLLPMVFLLIGGSLWIMSNLNYNMMPMDQIMQMQR